MEEENLYQNDLIEVYTIRTTRLNYVNYCYIVRDKETKQILVVDPSWQLDKLEEVLNKLGGEVSTILLTHSHYDHTNLANDLYLKYQPKYNSVQEQRSYKFWSR